jgi:hypothetical protein
MQLLRDSPFTAIFWSITEPTRRALLAAETNPRHPHALPSTSSLLFANMSAAGCAGAIAAATTTPFDVIKTQQQTSQRNTTLLDTARQIHRRSGVRGFFAGVVPRSVRAVPAGAIVVSTYEILKVRLRAMH